MKKTLKKDWGRKAHLERSLAFGERFEAFDWSE